MNYAQEIFVRLKQLIEQFSEVECARLVESCKSATPEVFLTSLNRLWETFCQQLVGPLIQLKINDFQLLIRSVFLYLDRTHRVQNSSTISIWLICI